MGPQLEVELSCVLCTLIVDVAVLLAAVSVVAHAAGPIAAGTIATELPYAALTLMLTTRDAVEFLTKQRMGKVPCE